MEEIDSGNIVGSRTRRKAIDFVKANEADDLPESDEDDEDFEEDDDDDAMQQ